LTFIQSIPVSFFVDNVFINENSRLISVGHPNGILFASHSNNPQKYRAPSEVILFPHPTSNPIKMLHFYIINKKYFTFII
jgi:hypothetical protein